MRYIKRLSLKLIEVFKIILLGYVLVFASIIPFTIMFLIFK